MPYYMESKYEVNKFKNIKSLKRNSEIFMKNKFDLKIKYL